MKTAELQGLYEVGYTNSTRKYNNSVYKGNIERAEKYLNKRKMYSQKISALQSDIKNNDKQVEKIVSSLGDSYIYKTSPTTYAFRDKSVRSDTKSNNEKYGKGNSGLGYYQTSTGTKYKVAVRKNDKQKSAGTKYKRTPTAYRYYQV